jgi:hypothetical protein
VRFPVCYGSPSECDVFAAAYIYIHYAWGGGGGEPGAVVANATLHKGGILKWLKFFSGIE